MQTTFSPAQLADPHVAESEKILRKCVHCGFCTATCPTYVTLGNELDSPRGRIYLIKDMLENGRPADREIVTHIDRCLSCLSCMTTCPSGVNYMHLVDHARAHIEKTYDRPLADRLVRALLAATLPYPRRFPGGAQARGVRTAVRKAVRRPAGAEAAGVHAEAGARLRAGKASPVSQPGRHAPRGERRGRVALLTGCAQSVLEPGINEATVRLLTRLGVEVVVPPGEGCCGALVHHMGKRGGRTRRRTEKRRCLDARDRAQAGSTPSSSPPRAAARRSRIMASCCGSIRPMPTRRRRCRRFAKDITEYLATLDLPEPSVKPGLTVAYHSACSMQHGQKITRQPKELLTRAGFFVKEPREGTSVLRLGRHLQHPAAGDFAQDCATAR
jgi:glycolate oxidase iron-sulfur subunit